MQKKLSVPENIPLRWEAWRGFGAPELAASLAVTGVSLVAAIVYRVVSGEDFSPIIAVSIVGFTFALCVGLFSKLDNNQSIFDFVIRQLEYKKNQQEFLYKKGKEVVRFAEKES